MQIRFVSGESVGRYKVGARATDGEEKVNFILFGFGGMGEVSYEKELKGETAFFEEVARLSKRENAVIVSGCITNTRGHRRKSAVVAEKGKLLGVSDMLYVGGGEYGCGAELRLYETRVGKMGVIVGEDLYFPETAQALTACGCDFLVCPFGTVTGGVASALVRAYGFLYGTPLFLCGKGYCMAANAEGELAFSSPLPVAELSFTVKKEYRLVERRRKGIVG